LGFSRTGLGLGPRLSRPKTETGLDFQTLSFLVLLKLGPLGVTRAQHIS
jgi:hypothetical protein